MRIKNMNGSITLKVWVVLYLFICIFRETVDNIIYKFWILHCQTYCQPEGYNCTAYLQVPFVFSYFLNVHIKFKQNPTTYSGGHFIEPPSISMLESNGRFKVGVSV